jgi:hypothetical protein
MGFPGAARYRQGMHRLPLIFMLACAGGCATTSTAGRFVTNLDVRAGRLVVLDCSVDYTVSGDGFFSKKTKQFSTSDCRSTALALTASAAPRSSGDSP